MIRFPRHPMVLAVLVASGAASAQYRDDYAPAYAAGRENVSYAYAQVTRVDPIYETVRTRVPEEICGGEEVHEVRRSHGGTVVGSPRIPGALVPLGSVDGGGWTRLTEMLGTLDGTRLSALLGVAPEVAAALRTADADAAASSAAPAAPSSPRPGSEA